MLFNTDVLQFDIYSLPVVLTALPVVGLGFTVLMRQHASLVGRRYMAFAMSVALYAFGAGVSFAVPTAERALLWDRIAHVGVVSIPFTLYAATVAILGETPRRRAITRSLAIVTAGLLVLLWTSTWIISGTQRLFWAWYPRYGFGGLLFVGYFGVIIFVTIAMYLERLRDTRERVARHRLRALVGANLLGLGGAIDFLPTMGLELYSIGFAFITGFSVVTGFAILRYRLVDITPELASTAILEAMQSAVLVIDNDDVIRVANAAAHEIAGVPEPHLRNAPAAAIAPRLFVDTGLGEVPVPFSGIEIPWATDGGDATWLSVSAVHLTDRGGRVLGTVYVGHDISARKHAEAQLQRAALYDDLTGLPNRKLFFEHIDTMISSARRMSEHAAILYLDLDGFKGVNDGMGHAAGDDVLRKVAQRLASTVRGSDLVARIGGDEFVVLLGHLKAEDDAALVADKLNRALEEPIALESGEARIGASVGVAVWPRDGNDPDTLLAIADTRMYAAKHGGRLERRDR